MTHAEAIQKYIDDGYVPEPGFINRVMIFPNLMCAVFNEHGKQMPQYQGLYSEMEPIIKEALRIQGVRLRWDSPVPLDDVSEIRNKPR